MTQSLEVVRREALDRAVASAVSRLGVLACPWILLVLLYGMGAFAHWVWGDPPAVTWAVLAVAATTAILTWLTWLISHQRGPISRIHSTITMVGVGLWFAIALIEGVWNLHVSGLLFFIGGPVALAWNQRAVIRLSPSQDRTVDPLKQIFDRAKVGAKAGIEGSELRGTQIDENKATTKASVPDGKTVRDMQRAVPALEAAAGVPPGSFQVSPDEDDAGTALLVATDPRAMRQPIPWIGPYRPGGSLVDPIRIGLYQDMDPVLFVLHDYHLKASGMTGAGKSFGGTWNLIAELCTRIDPVLWAADMSKADQTLGALEAALDWVVYDEDGAMDMLQAIQNVIEPRMAYLARKRLKGWQRGCGIKALVVFLEEAADIFDAMGSKDLEDFINSMRRARSAGIYIVLSLQRFDFSQAPTIIRAMITGSLCFGVESEGDADFGLPKHVRKAGAQPERWQGNYPGMCYLVAPGVPDAKQPMPIRTYFIADDVMRRHTAHYPAADRPLDEVTALAAGPRYAKRIRTRPGFSVYEAMTGHGNQQARPEPRFGGEEETEPAATEKTGPAAPPDPPTPREADTGAGGSDREDDALPDDFAELVVQAAELVVAREYATTESLQRALRLKHHECLQVMDALERRGVVGPPVESGSRRVLVDRQGLEQAVEGIRELGDAVTEYVHTADPDPRLPAQEIPETAEDGLRTPAGPDGKMTPEAAQHLVVDWIRHRHATGELSFSATDPELQQIRRQAGMSSRTWVHGVLQRLTEARALDRDASGKSVVWRIRDVDRLDDGQRVPS